MAQQQQALQAAIQAMQEKHKKDQQSTVFSQFLQTQQQQQERERQRQEVETVAQQQQQQMAQILHGQLFNLQVQRLLPPGMQAASAGIGINIRKILPADGSAPLLHHGLYLVTQLAPAGGAAQAGYIEVGDVIHAVEGVHVGPLELAAVIEKIKGVPGSHVTLQLQKAASWAQYEPQMEQLQKAQRQQVRA